MIRRVPADAALASTVFGMPVARTVRPLATAVALLVCLALVACASGEGGAEPTPSTSASDSPSASPSASDEPRAPAAGELVLTPNGMGTLVIGEAPSTEPAQQMLEEDPAACSDENTGFDAGVEPGDPQALRWVPIPAYNPPGGYAPWSVDVHDGILMRIDLHDGSIPTDEGIRIGAVGTDALAAYPDAAVVEEWATDVLVVPGEHGVLHIEIARERDDDTAGYWGDQLGRVVFIRSVDLDGGVFTVAASENIAGGCL